MFSSISESTEKTEAVFQALRERAQQHPPELHEAWFEPGLFKTRSAFVDDYLKEAQTNAEKLAQVPPDAPVFDYMNQVVQAQLTALVQALYRN